MPSRRPPRPRCRRAGAERTPPTGTSGRPLALRLGPRLVRPRASPARASARCSRGNDRRASAPAPASPGTREAPGAREASPPAASWQGARTSVGSDSPRMGDTAARATRRRHVASGQASVIAPASPSWASEVTRRTSHAPRPPGSRGRPRQEAWPPAFAHAPGDAAPRVGGAREQAVEAHGRPVPCQRRVDLPVDRGAQARDLVPRGRPRPELGGHPPGLAGRGAGRARLGDGGGQGALGARAAPGQAGREARAAPGPRGPRARRADRGVGPAAAAAASTVRAPVGARAALCAARLVSPGRHDLVGHGGHRRVRHVAQARRAARKSARHVPRLGVVMGYPVGAGHRFFPLGRFLVGPTFWDRRWSSSLSSHTPRFSTRSWRHQKAHSVCGQSHTMRLAVRRDRRMWFYVRSNAQSAAFREDPQLACGFT